MKRAELALWAFGLGGLLASGLGWVFVPRLFPHAWLAAFVFWIKWPMGAMGLLLVHAITGGRWGETARPALVLGVLTLPLMLLAVVPVALEWPALYPWLHPVHTRLLNGWYLNLGAFIGRNVAYLIISFVVAALVLERVVLRLTAAPALILLALTITGASFDTTMSMDPKFVSSIYGMLAATDAVVLAMAIAALLSAPALNPFALTELARVLCGLCFLWTYLEFIQMLVIWNSDLASEAPYLLHRIEGFWGTVFAAFMLGHGLLAGFVLMMPRLQRRRAVVMGVAGFVLALQLMRGWWVVLPFVPRTISWVDVACMAGMAGTAAALALSLYNRPQLIARWIHA